MRDLTDILSIPILEIEKKLFELRDFDFITITERGQNKKQEAALNALTGGDRREVLYGGAAGGAKSWTGATWLTFMAETRPGTRWFIGRESLKSIKESTYITFLKVFKAYGIEAVKYNANDHYLLFSNGSRIDFLELRYYPSDPLFERFGSLEYTGGWIEEAGEIAFGAFDVLKTRVGRHLNDQYGITPILFITCNPKKNWLYYFFYTLWKQNKLPAHRIFIQAFIHDNPAVDTGYLTQLRSLEDKSKRARLLLGDWDYSDDPSALCEFDSIVALFTNDHVKPTGDKYGSADLAMQGRDKFIGGFRDGMVVRIPIDMAKSTGKEIELAVKGMLTKEGIPHTKMVADSDGLGSFLESYLKSIKEFHGGAQANDKKTFANLKSECAYKLAEVVNKHEMLIICTEEQQQKIIEELGALKALDVDSDEVRKRVIKKDAMKDILGRSPDYLDFLIMLMFFLVKIKPAEPMEQTPGGRYEGDFERIKRMYGM